jgi:hypothetical protein
MDIGPANKIYETPIIKKEENSSLPDKRKQKKQKKEQDQEQEKGERKIDIKI